MESRAKAFGHPIHPMLIVLPVGLFVMAVVSDILYLITRSSIFAIVSFVNIAGGIIGGLLAAIFGFLDYQAIPAGTRAKSIAATHGIGNVVVVAMFAISWLIRNADETIYPPALALIFSFAGIIVATITVWLGGELVDRLGVGVDPGANLNAPSSLSGQPAHSVSHQASEGMPAVASVPVTGENRGETLEQPRASHQRIREADLQANDPLDPNTEGHEVDEP